MVSSLRLNGLAETLETKTMRKEWLNASIHYSCRHQCPENSEFINLSLTVGSCLCSFRQGRGDVCHKEQEYAPMQTA